MIMLNRSRRIKRIFAGGWLSDANASIMALIWQVQGGEGQETGPDQFEAEVIRGVEKIAALSSHSVEELRQTLDSTYGSKAEDGPSAPPEPS